MEKIYVQQQRIMEKIIVIVFKNGQRVVWEQNEWTDYAYDGKAFIVKKGNDWIGIYNFDSIISVVVKER